LAGKDTLLDQRQTHDVIVRVVGGVEILDQERNHAQQTPVFQSFEV